MGNTQGEQYGTTPTGSVASLEALAAEVGARDLFVLRQVAPGRFAHLGGSGRGEGWAGVVELEIDAEPTGAAAMASGEVVHVRGEQPVHVFGPYWSTQAVFVPIDHERLVVLGGLDGDHPASEAVLRAAAERAEQRVGEVSPAKRLADELEVAHAVKEVLSIDATGIAEAARAVVSTVTAALSCELGVLWLRCGDRVSISERGFAGPAAGPELAAAMRGLTAAGLPAHRQGAHDAPLPAHLDLPGITSWYAVPVGRDAELGALLVCHTETAPRGFTNLCRDLGARAADASAGVLRAAALRDELRSAASDARQEARTDGLTGLGNRMAWDEAAARTPEPLCVLFADVDGLKAVNDAAGHHAGDDLLRAMADVLREAVRTGDLLARLGGDEFAVLLPGADGLAARAVGRRVEALLAARKPLHGFRLSATIALAAAPPQSGAEGALRAADAVVCAEKQRRCSARD